MTEARTTSLTVKEIAVRAAEYAYRQQRGSAETDSTETVITNTGEVQRGVTPRFLVKKGTEDQRVPADLVGDEKAQQSWLDQRLAPQVPLLTRLLYSVPLGKERGRRSRVVEFHRGVKKGKVDVYDRHGKVPLRRA